MVEKPDTSDLGIGDADATRFYMRPTSQALLSLVGQAMLIVYIEYATLFPPTGTSQFEPTAKEHG